MVASTSLLRRPYRRVGRVSCVQAKDTIERDRDEPKSVTCSRHEATLTPSKGDDRSRDSGPSLRRRD